MHRGKNNELSKEGKGNTYRAKKEVKMNYLFLVPATIHPTAHVVC